MLTRQKILEIQFSCSREDGQRAVGCPGLDTPFKDWPYRNLNSPIYGSPALQCNKNTYHNLASIVDSFASDQQHWSGNY